MPIVQVSLIEGRPEEQIEAMIRGVTDVVSTTLQAPRESIRVIVQSVPRSRWGIGGVTASQLADRNRPDGTKSASGQTDR